MINHEGTKRCEEHEGICDVFFRVLRISKCLIFRFAAFLEKSVNIFEKLDIDHR